MKECQIHNTDCLEFLKTLHDKSIDLILQDPPYNTTACAWEWDIMTKIDEFWAEWKRVIKDNGAIVMTASQPFTSKLVMSNLKMFKYEWVWDKKKAGNFATGNIQPLKVHENIIVFANGKTIYNPQKMLLEKPQTRHLGKKSKNIDNAIGIKGEIKYGKNYEPDKKLPITIIEFSKDNYRKNVFHPTQKPVALMEYLIKTYTNEGDTVFDGFMGSGTTGVACKNLNRNFIGCELDEKYCDIAHQRINEAEGSISLD